VSRRLVVPSLVLAGAVVAVVGSAQLERAARRAIGMPARHPERVSGSDWAARRGHFPRWAAELAELANPADIIESTWRDT
jgi:hypothetical protein